MRDERLKELDVVQLVVDTGRWPAGTLGTIVETFPSSALVEISDRRGHSEDFVTVPYHVLRSAPTDEDDGGANAEADAVGIDEARAAPVTLESQAVIDELEQRIREYVLAEMPHDASGELSAKGTADLLLAYGNWRSRFVRSHPRRAHLSKELIASPKLQEHKSAIDAIVATIEEGGDLTPHLSRRITSAYIPTHQRKSNLGARRDLDLLISDWGLHHLHLTTEMEADGFYKRTADLLFAKFTDEDAYLIAIYDHNGNWAEKDLLRILIRNWPDAGVLASMSGLRLAQETSDEEHLVGRKGGVAQLVEIDDTVYMPAGMTTAGTPIDVTLRVNSLMHTLAGLRTDLPAVLADVEGRLDDETIDRVAQNTWSPMVYRDHWGFLKGDVFIPFGPLW